MAHSFFFRRRPSGTGPSTEKRRVLVTGAAGRIGSYFAEHSRQRHELRLMTRENEDAAAIEAFGEVVRGDITVPESFRPHLEGVDTVVHLAANPHGRAEWEELLQPNIIGAYHVFEEARRAGCRRVVFASSIHAVNGYPGEMQVKADEPVSPDNLYGTTKCFGEALGRCLANRGELSVIVLRIGGFQSRESLATGTNHASMSIAVSRRDLNQLINRCIDDDSLQFAIFQATSDNRCKRMDISDARELVGYEPEDDAFEIAGL